MTLLIPLCLQRCSLPLYRLQYPGRDDRRACGAGVYHEGTVHEGTVGARVGPQHVSERAQ